MKKWKEYSKKLSEYYGWVTHNLETKWNACLISYNASGLHIDKDEFFDFCMQQVQNDIVLSNNLYIYLVVLEEVINSNSKVELHKKCWKKISSSFEIDFLQLGEEVLYCYDDKLYYASVAKTQIYNLNRVLKLVDLKKQHRFIFISENDYFDNVEHKDIKLDDFIKLNCYGSIDYSHVVEKCIFNHDLACCYGSDSLGIELAFIFKSEDDNKFIKNI